MIKRGIMKRKTKRYYPNNVRAVSNTESEYFPSMPFDEFYAHYVYNWLLPRSHECVIRATSLKTGKVKEYSYKYRAAAENKIKALIHTHEFVVCDHEAIHKLSPHPENREKTNKADTSS
jgi:hypothetical protein